ncbi:acyl-CoA dehydrogenase family protein [Nonomuraea salmonea]|uniref:acyl-CoA dehydrogenase family protein n=1 Tax=Nonomuraea salmonea TaxID=46181 RepID=UPI002FEC096F
MSLREEARAFLEESLSGPFAHARGLGGPGREHEGHELRQAWERHLGKHGWTCLAWPERYGGRAASLEDQVAFHEEYARADAPPPGSATSARA